MNDSGSGPTSPPDEVNAKLDDPNARREEISRKLAPTIVAEPLRSMLDADESGVAGPPRPAGAPPYEVIIDMNLAFPRGVEAAKQLVMSHIREMAGEDRLERNVPHSRLPYVFARLDAKQIRHLIEFDSSLAVHEHGKIKAAAATADAAVGESPPSAIVSPSPVPPEADDEAPGTPHRAMRTIHRIWLANTVASLATVSIRTVKADAAQIAFSASGADIVWAVVDSGIDVKHAHFKKFDNCTLKLPLAHQSFKPPFKADADEFGHGTHVAGIIAGRSDVANAATLSVDAHGDSEYHLTPVNEIRGMAPECKLLSLRVLDDKGLGDDIALLQAIDYIQQLNDNGRNVVVHGVNLSVGYPFEAEAYACGQTPVCVEVDRLVKSGVVVVAAAGNTGYVKTLQPNNKYFAAGQFLSINDPGNARLAITVGSTHREKPHMYGVSYFSSKGPTEDGRMKPDVVAPGEKIISCAAGANVAKVTPTATVPAGSFEYIEDTGTSMSAPHVSGIIAGFLSIRREYIGQAETVRDLAINAARDLQRDRTMQGAGLVDLMNMLAIG